MRSITNVNNLREITIRTDLCNHNILPDISIGY